ncbi:peptidase M15 [Streptomyces sp. NPDC054783]
MVVGLAVVTAVITAALGHQVPKPSSTSASLPSSAASPSKSSPAASPHASGGEQRGAPGDADGVVPDGATVFGDAIPAVANLDAGLFKALRRAATAATDAGVEFYAGSGGRSPEYQSQLLRETDAEYGSEDEAARWVAAAAASPHVSADADGIGRSHATALLSRHGAAYGMCRICKNEARHYELRPDATGRRCPRMHAAPTQDPGTQQ